MHEIGIDNRCSACISCDINGFIGPLVKTNRIIKGFGGTRTTNIQVGTICWKWVDDDGKIHSFDIPNSYYIPSGQVHLLRPQHWAKVMKDTNLIEETGYTINSKSIQLWWNQNSYHLTVPLSKTTNVATFNSAPGYSKYHTFCKEAEISFNEEDDNPILVDTTIVDDNEDIDVLHQTPSSTRDWSSPNT